MKPPLPGPLLHKPVEEREKTREVLLHKFALIWPDCSVNKAGEGIGAMALFQLLC
jgi:hypothetical protein